LVAGSISSDFQFYEVGRGFNSKRLKTSVESLALSDSKFEQVGRRFNSEEQHLLSIVTSASILFVSCNVDIKLAAFIKMSKRRGRNNSRGGRGRDDAGYSGRGRDRGQNYTGSANAAKRGLCTNIGTNVSDYGQKSAADQMCTSWGKIAQYIGTNYGQDIKNEL
jgi:hypothetical protein